MGGCPSLKRKIFQDRRSRANDLPSHFSQDRWTSLDLWWEKDLGFGTSCQSLTGYPNTLLASRGNQGRPSKTDFQAGPGGRGLFPPEGGVQESGSPASPPQVPTPRRDTDGVLLGPLGGCCPRPCLHFPRVSQNGPPLSGAHLDPPGQGRRVPLAQLR